MNRQQKRDRFLEDIKNIGAEEAIRKLKWRHPIHHYTAKTQSLIQEAWWWIIDAPITPGEDGDDFIGRRTGKPNRNEYIMLVYKNGERRLLTWKEWKDFRKNKPDDVYMLTGASSITAYDDLKRIMR